MNWHEWRWPITIMVCAMFFAIAVETYSKHMGGCH